MTMTATTDILFDKEPRNDDLREAAARAFDASVSLVNLRTTGDLDPVDPASRIQVIR